VKELVKNLSVLHNVTLVVNKWDGSIFEGVSIVEMDCPKLCSFVWRVILSLFYIMRLLIFENIDLFYAKSPLEGSVAAFLGFFFKIPLVYEVNGLIVEESKMKGENIIHVLFSCILEKTAITCASHVTCVTPWIKEILLKGGIPSEKVTVVENGADTSTFSPVENAKKVLNMNPDTLYVGYIGTLKVWQGLDHILDAVPFILQKMPGTEVLIVGGGELKEWLLCSIRERGLHKVTVLDEVSHKDVPLYMSACDVCMLLKKPLSSGYSPLKLYEYLACERPVVASRVHGFECLEEENAGILVDQETPQEVADAVCTLLKDENLRNAMGKRGRKFVLTFHTWEKVAQKISTVCIKVLAAQEKKSER